MPFFISKPGQVDDKHINTNLMLHLKAEVDEVLVSKYDQHPLKSSCFTFTFSARAIDPFIRKQKYDNSIIKIPFK